MGASWTDGTVAAGRGRHFFCDMLAGCPWVTVDDRCPAHPNDDNAPETQGAGS